MDDSQNESRTDCLRSERKVARGLLPGRRFSAKGVNTTGRKYALVHSYCGEAGAFRGRLCAWPQAATGDARRSRSRAAS
jgi:hypothetical protein